MRSSNECLNRSFLVRTGGWGLRFPGSRYVQARRGEGNCQVELGAEASRFRCNRVRKRTLTVHSLLVGSQAKSVTNVRGRHQKCKLQKLMLVLKIPSQNTCARVFELPAFFAPIFCSASFRVIAATHATCNSCTRCWCCYRLLLPAVCCTSYAYCCMWRARRIQADGTDLSRSWLHTSKAESAPCLTLLLASPVRLRVVAFNWCQRSACICYQHNDCVFSLGHNCTKAMWACIDNKFYGFGQVEVGQCRSIRHGQFQTVKGLWWRAFHSQVAFFSVNSCRGCVI